MKLISEQEALEHKHHIFRQCYKGCVAGTAIGIGLFTYMKFRQPVKFNSFNWTIKSCMIGMPLIGCATFASLKGSARFLTVVTDQNIYQVKAPPKVTSW